MTDHLAALLHLPCPERPSLWSQVAECPEIGHFVQHRVDPGGRDPDGFALTAALGETLPLVHADVLADPAVSCAFGGTVGRFTVAQRLTRTGFDLDPRIRAALDHGAQRAPLSEGALS
jgi:hypothetical protein